MSESKAILPRAGAAFAALVMLLPIWATSAAAEAPMPFGQGLLWRIEAKGRPASHVFGTMHVADERIRDIPKPVRTALARSDSLSIEMIMEPEDQPRFVELTRYTDGRTLDEVLGPRLFARAVRAVSPLGMSADDIRPLKPWFVSGLVGTHPDEATRRSGGRVPLDAALVRFATFRGHRLFGLETFDEHFALFDTMTEQEQVKMLKLAVNDRFRVVRYYERLVRHYLARDLTGLMAMLSEYQAGLDPELRKAYEEKLLFARNENMVRRMRRHLKKGRAFVAVGAAHLPGERGVLNLLSESGFDVTRVY